MSLIIYLHSRNTLEHAHCLHPYAPQPQDHDPGQGHDLGPETAREAGRYDIQLQEFFYFF